ncbi:MAG TPA: glycosyltransferase family 2 protein [Oxalicibacterium sp.]|uniref:glycosyltransferase family 2 protein n=1 Tax=Oxalicibacterium sp. TaxID=2766525 RepID=UPI002CF9E506|nr:glycosyltransferase family 2 protein [Oxalicibacterium sp.]HWU97882.1 glycosyltransferase family 2 protein [Oxalicibacterium sp.]
MSWQILVDCLAAGIIGYFILSRTGNFLINLLAIFRLRDLEREKVLADLPLLHAGLEQPISILLTTRDEAATIVAKIRTLLQLDYSSFEIVVVNNGSRDATMAELTGAFDLHPFPEAYRVRLKTKAVRGIHRSAGYKNLRVIDQEAGSTADALNAGINAARYPLLCSVASDTLLRRDCLQRLAAPFVSDNQVMAATASVRVGNECKTTNGLLAGIVLPERWLSRLQLIDQLRASLFAPLGWSIGNATLLTTPGISLLRKEAVIHADGYSTQATDPQMEIIVRLHRAMREKRQPYSIRFVAEPICVRNVPDSLYMWKEKRTHYQRALADSLHLNTRWPLRNAGLAGHIAFPFVLLFESWGPLIELFGYLFMLAAFAGGVIPAQAFGAFMMAAIGFGILLSASGLLLEEMSFHTYSEKSDVLALALAAVFANLGYAQLDTVWRSMAMLQRKQESASQTTRPEQT